MFGLLAFLWSIGEVTRVWNIGFGTYRSDSPHESLRLLTGHSSFSFGFKSVCFSLLTFLGLFLLTRGFRWLVNSLASSSSPRLRITRTKLLIGVAVALFAAKTAQDVFFPAGFLYSINVFGGDGYLGRILLAAFGFLVALLLPSWLLTRDIKARLKIQTILLLALVISAVCIVRMSVVRPGLDHKLTIVINGFVMFSFYIALIAVGEPNNRFEAKKSSPSAWSILPLVLLVASGVLVYFFDINTLAGTSVRNWPNLDWVLARKAKVIARRSDYQIGIVTNQGMPGVIGSLDESTPSDLFAGLEGHSFQFVSLCGLRANIDVRTLFGWPELNLSESEVTSQQLQGLAQKAIMLNLADIRVTDPRGNVALTSFGNVHIRDGSEQGDFVSLLNSLGSQKSPQFQVDFGEIDWDTAEAISRLSTKANIRIYGGCLKSLANCDSKGELEWSRVVVENSGNIFESQKHFAGESSVFKFVLNSNIFVKFNRNHGNFWDLAFAKNREAMPDYWPLEASIMDMQKFVDEAEHNHWNFGEDRAKLQKLFLPGAEALFSSGPKSFETLKEVEVLGLDPSWLSGVDPRVRYYRKKSWVQPHRGLTFSGLEKLKNLRRLDFNTNALVGDEKLLTRIPKIEHLQVRFEPNIIHVIDFSICKNLKSLVYFGIPSKNMIADLSSLKNLKSLTVIYEIGNLLSNKEKKNIVASIPSVKIELVLLADFVPVPPVEFSTHAIKQSTEIRKRWGVEPQSSIDQPTGAREAIE